MLLLEPGKLVRVDYLQSGKAALPARVTPSLSRIAGKLSQDSDLRDRSNLRTTW